MLRLHRIEEERENKEMKTRKILAVIGALIAGGLAIALVSSVLQAAHAGLTMN
jgi:hypothetical protein